MAVVDGTGNFRAAICHIIPAPGVTQSVTQKLCRLAGNNIIEVIQPPFGATDKPAGFLTF